MATKSLKYIYIHLPYMATKTITVTTDAYDRLAALKGEKDSFSDVIKRVTKRSSLLDLAGIMPKEAVDKLETSIKENRGRFDRDMEERRKRWKL